MQKDLIQYLGKFIKERRFDLLNKTVKNRTKYITVVLEDIFQPQNASAVLRSCDCFGIQDVHIIENKNEYRINPDVVRGASKWLNLYRYNEKKENTISTIKKLKEQGYRIIATTPHGNDVCLNEFDINKGKFALMFGSEMPGLTRTAMENADEFLKIDMFGFTESFNISVSAAICLHHLSWRLRNSKLNYKLSETEQNELMLYWLRKTIKRPELIISKFMNKVE